MSSTEGEDSGINMRKVIQSRQVQGGHELGFTKRPNLDTVFFSVFSSVAKINGPARVAQRHFLTTTSPHSSTIALATFPHFPRLTPILGTS